MISRISDCFRKMRAERRAALITFIMGGDPDLATTGALLKALPAAGADILEIGMPFSDPMADGPVIQAAGLRALRNGTHIAQIFELVTAFRKVDNATPVILMGYYNPIFHYGIAHFCEDASRAGVDGIIIVDLPPEEEAEFKGDAEQDGIAMIRLVAPTSLKDRLPLLLESCQGFVYYIAIAGITGAASADIGELEDQVQQLKEQASLPVAVGFGVKTAEQVKQIAAFSNGVVVGSALVSVMAKAVQNRGDVVAEATDFVRSLAKGLHHN